MHLHLAATFESTILVEELIHSYFLVATFVGILHIRAMSIFLLRFAGMIHAIPHL